MSETKDDITELRGLLFASIREVKAGTLAVDRAEKVSELASVLIDTGKLEVAFLQTVGREVATGFLPEQKPVPGMPRLVQGKAMSGSE